MTASIMNNIKKYYFDKINTVSPFNAEYIKNKYGFYNTFVTMNNIELPSELNSIWKLLLSGSINSKNINNMVDSLLLYDLGHSDSSQFNKIHLIYSLLISLYIKNNNKKNIIIPYNLSIPILYIHKKSNIAPILTYSDLILNNTKIYSVDDKKNIEIEYHLTNSDIEKKYYATFLKIELSAGKILNTIFDILNKVSEGKEINDLLKYISDIINNFTQLLSDFSGEEKLELSNIFFFQKKYNMIQFFGEKYICDNLENPYNFYEITIAQSPLIQTLNIFLNINSTYIKKNILYCSGTHQEFLSEFESYISNNNITIYMNKYFKEDYDECKKNFNSMLNAYLSILSI
ncbi:indoleamine 2,3-dioxygenase [Catovirus CTV1]|uniref:Indoleamine 2,3-dioxygenase n=1 Tax=Catovirus CTV1 TaxID=1977631 RepID=A0A1V0SAS2_9VIRU|nr:indoleamine 2,3-dioxygenase [Catovirus CTV1]